MTEEPAAWYRDFFEEAYLALYADRLTEKHTKREVQLVLDALKLQPRAAVLDVACGPGRHAIRLARHGLNVTGFDLNASYLEAVRKAAKEAGVEIQTVAGDMREMPFEGCFDAVLSLFTSFGYFESEEDDQRVLANFARALKPGGKVLIDVGNRDYHIDSQDGRWLDGPDGDSIILKRTFDPVTSILTTQFFRAVEGQPFQDLGGHGIRLYTLTELVRMLQREGLKFTACYGDYRGKAYAPRTPRMIVVAGKSE